MMNKIMVYMLAAISVATLSAQNYSLDEIVGGRFLPKTVPEMVSSADGAYWYQADSKNMAVLKYSFATGEVVDTLFSTMRARNCDFNSFEGFLVSDDENRVLLYRDREQIYRRSFKANYYYYDVRRNLVRRLSDQSSKQMVPIFSSDSKMAAYVVDNNIWLAKFDFDTESQVTVDGEPGRIINGIADWVYEEEFGVTRLMEFSPDSRQLAFVRSDESEVGEFTFQTFEEQLYPDYYSFKYPKAGEKNSKVECKLFDIESRVLRSMELPVEEDCYIARIKFTKSANQLAVMMLNRDQNRLDIYFVNPRSTVARLVLREESKYYIDSEWLNSIHFLKDKFTYISEKDGYSHIYIYGITGTLQRQLTKGEYDVTALLAVDPVTETLFYQAADESPLQRNIYRLALTGGEPQKLSHHPGENRAQFSNNGKYMINRWSDMRTPAVVTLHDATGKELRVLEDNSELRRAVASAGFPDRELIDLPAADGLSRLNGWILKPANFDPGKKYPVVIVQYGGPNSQQVLDRFNIGWWYALLDEGFVVASVDGRGTGARGEEFRKCNYMNLGIIESDDMIAAAGWLGSLPYVDSERIGIWGWSYGGYNVLMSMSRGDGIFKAGVAIAPVTDWRFYDTIYSERFMRRPQQNSEGYRRGSPIELARQMQGNLLLIHGTADDNVHFQNSVEYSRALIRENKHFDMFIFPDKNHFISGGGTTLYLYNRVINWFKMNL